MANFRRFTPCVVCDSNIAYDTYRCTNQCCGACHELHCTRGGRDTPGHGINVAEAKAKRAARIKAGGTTVGA